MNEWAGIAAALAVLMGGAAPASAQADAPPDPATVTLPDLTPPRDPRAIKNGWKHFYFHKAGVTYEQAYADFSQCYRYLPVANADPNLPMFAPWREAPGVDKIYPTNNYGLIGMGIAALFAGTLQRKAYQSRLIRCLETRGYVRYPLAESVWRELVDDYSERSIAAQAKAAALPAPDARPVTR